MRPAVKHYPITVKLYHIMADEGYFAPDERIELIDGEIIEMSPIGSRHAACVDLLNRLPIIATQDSEPQPDLSVLRFREDFYRTEHPRGSDVILVVEVGDTSAGFDRSRKIPKYAAAGIPEAWLIDLESGHVEVHFAPKSTTYGMVRVYQRGETVTSETIPQISLSVDEILG